MTHPKLFFLFALSLATTAAVTGTSTAEPNEDFFEATVLAPGVFAVSDDITGSPAPAADTTLGAFDEFGGLIESDDDNSSYGDGLASALFDIPVNADGSIELAVSGYEDLDFDGIDDFSGFGHIEEGAYDLFVDIFDSGGSPIDFIGDSGSLVSGAVDTFSYSDPAWIGGTFTVEIDNLSNFEPGDVDFWRFTGLTPGLPFTAEITDGDFDTVLGLFDDTTGDLLVEDDDGGVGGLSLLSDVVPASGDIVLAVSGFDDFGFIGVHTEFGDYTLTVTIIPEPLTLCLAAFAAPLLLTRRRRV